MLLTLRIENFVLIDRLELDFEPGFNVITGETGAGKSIVVGALALALGGRARADLVRGGAKQATVEALFDISHSAAVTSWLDAHDLSDGQELILRRVVQSNGRSRGYINGRLCSARDLAELAPDLADVTSQHEGVALADSTRHIDYLDHYAGLQAQRTEMAEHVAELTALVRELDGLLEAERERTKREDLVRYQLDAIEAVDPQPGEVDALDSERARLRHAGQLRDTCAHGSRTLDSDDALCDRLAQLVAQLQTAAAIDDGLTGLASTVEECWERLRDAAADMERYAERLEADPQRLEQINDRLFRLEQLMRRHGSLDDVMQARSELQDQLQQLDDAPARIAQLTQAKEQQLDKAGDVARKLSQRRKRAAKKLAAKISTELDQLGMGKARVVVDVRRSEAGALSYGGAAMGMNGIDRVEFLIAPNRGVEPRPLGRIASGGELSRTLLALKCALSAEAVSDPGTAGAQRGAQSGVQVFDEVDAGVGGDAADRIGKAIARLAPQRQILCITHMPSIAAYADAHFVVHKEHADTTTSTIERVDGRERVAELARMLTGDGTGSSSKVARELLRRAGASSATLKSLPLQRVAGAA